MRRAALFALLISCGAQLSLAANVPIANAGFEDFVLTCTAGPLCNEGNVAAWTGTGQFATFMPSVGPGGEYPNGIPEGVNVAALGNNTGNGVLVQTLGITLQPNSTYTLSRPTKFGTVFELDLFRAQRSER
jgi:hapalindole biogenesis HpiC1 cyclase-like protein